MCIPWNKKKDKLYAGYENDGDLNEHGLFCKLCAVSFNIVSYKEYKNMKIYLVIC